MADSTSSREMPHLPPEWVRTVLSLLIFIHLFTLGAALLGRLPVASELSRRLANVPFLAPYRQALFMDLPYSFALTRADTVDIDHTIEAVVELPEGPAQVLVMPDPSISPGERARHWQRLGRNMAVYVGDPDLESILPSYVGKGLVERYNGKDATIKLRGRFLQDRSAYARGADPLRAELVRDVYEARVWLSDGRPRIMKKEGVGEAAPAASGSTPLIPELTQ